MKREDYLNWDEYFMAIALLSKERSKDSSTQVGACIVKDKRILSIGYNGSPNNLPDELMKWAREGEYLDTKYPYIIHAEPNAILNFRGNTSDLVGSKLYVTLFPCNECAKLVIQAGIKEVVYLDDKYHDTEQAIAARWLFDKCGVTYTAYESFENKQRNITIQL